MGLLTCNISGLLLVFEIWIEFQAELILPALSLTVSISWIDL